MHFRHVQLIVLTSLAAMFGALLPSTMQQLLSEADLFWRVALAGLLALYAGQLLFVYRSMPADQGGGWLRTFYGPVAGFLTVASLLFQLALAGSVAGLFRESAPAIYSLSLLFLLFASAFHFLRLIRNAQPG